MLPTGIDLLEGLDQQTTPDVPEVFAHVRQKVLDWKGQSVNAWQRRAQATFSGVHLKIERLVGPQQSS